MLKIALFFLAWLVCCALVLLFFRGMGRRREAEDKIFEEPFMLW
jgi:hypothetical protein